LSDDENAVLLLSGVTAMVIWFRWFRSLSGLTRLGARRGLVAAVVLAPIACAALLFIVLRTWSAHDVRDDAGYLFFYEVLGAAWVGLAATAFSRLGISPRDDVAERHIAAVVPAVGGALLGATLCYAGSNVGDGPGWWCVAFTALLATAAFFALWHAIERFGRVSESVVVERDLASGLRLGGCLTALGLVLGRAAAGDWTGPADAAADFVRLGWPALVLAAGAVVAERGLRPSARVPRPSWLLAGVVPAALAVAAAAVWLVASRVPS
jgi:hypothetical protein